MPFHKASSLITPQPVTPPPAHRPSPSASQSHPSSSIGFGGLFSGAGTASTSWASMPTHTHSSSGAGLFSGTGTGAGANASGTSQVQWGATPTPLPASVQWGSTPSYTSPARHSTQPTHSIHAPSSVTPSHPLPDKSRKSESKRKRFEDEDDEMDGGIASSPSRRSPSVDAGGEYRQLAGRNLVPKRMRAGLGGVRLDHAVFNSPTSTPQPSADQKPDSTQRIPSAAEDEGDKVDLGKMLASLDKPHLLSLLSSLLAQNPTLTPTIRSLLPLPTLDFVNTSLDSYELSIKAALPFEASTSSGVETTTSTTSHVRPEYAWNRLRGPVAELVAGIQSWMDFFSSREAQDANQGREVHPATMFELLHTITMRVIKIQRDMLPVVPASILSTSLSQGTDSSSTRSENSASMPAQLLSSLPPALRSPSSPNAILTSLFPTLLHSWESLLRRISSNLNGGGKMYGREVIGGWLRGCETLRQEVEGRNEDDEQKRLVVETIRTCLIEIDRGFRREIGWCVGVYE